jgi:hypothetical protein
MIMETANTLNTATAKTLTGEIVNTLFPPHLQFVQPVPDGGNLLDLII